MSPPASHAAPRWGAPANVARLLLALVLGFALSAIPRCRIQSRNQATLVKFQPPSGAFPVVWTILYVLFGISWVLAATDPNALVAANTPHATWPVDGIYGATALTLAAWVVVYGCMGHKYAGVFVIAVAIGLTLLALNIVSVRSRLLLVPLLVWLVLALLLNTTEVQQARG